ncbi:hypothetical protein [Streptomyces sp. TLI_146]|uniref:hypothetical protein n=1 Tax=Streptomyces sp. TLI_146 TaxID=1938858 RepID=UPI0015D5A2C0|nr:hypothetical protein [Streptomyces sp. TLI_146]
MPNAAARSSRGRRPWIISRPRPSAAITAPDTRPSAMFAPVTSPPWRLMDAAQKP